MKILMSFFLLTFSTLSLAQDEPIVNLDSLEYYQQQLEWNFKDEYDFRNKCSEIIKYDGGYEFVVNNIDSQPRHPETHEYFHGYLMCFLTNKNKVLIKLLKGRIEQNLVSQFVMINSLFRMFDKKADTCNYINSLAENEDLSVEERNELQQKINYITSKSSEFQETCK